MALGAEIATSTINKILEGDGCVKSIPQEECMEFVGAKSEADLHHAPKIFKETCEINWQQPAKKVHDFIRGLSPYPGTWTSLSAPDEKELVMKIFKTRKTEIPVGGHAPGTISEENFRLFIATTDFLLEILELQITGKKRMNSRDFLNGFKKISHYSCK